MENKNFYDIIIIGGGVAGLTASIYLARANCRVVIIESTAIGGQIALSSKVENYPGILQTSGIELTQTMKKQAESFGTKFIFCNAISIHSDGDLKIVETSNGNYFCYGVIIAAGANPRVIGFEGEEKFKGRGISYCATCDAGFFRNKEVFVIGGGYSAAEESIYLAEFASHITIMMRKSDFTCAKSLSDKAKANPKITILPNTEVISVSGDNIIKNLKYKNNLTQKISEYNNDKGFGLFVFAGYLPATKPFKNYITLDEQGYIITDRTQKTNIDGIYAAGDVCVKNLRQVVTAVSDGATAATELEKYITDIKKID
ncbi:MAG: FAD-dependent oxidoreductase [Ruminococcus sp.]|nr:FAD-dependent oxidoreductase [Ruminococcus sp.]